MKPSSFSFKATAAYGGFIPDYRAGTLPIRVPADYGLDSRSDDERSKIECFRRYFSETPVVVENQIPYLFGFYLGEALRRRLEEEGFWIEKTFHDFGRTYRDARWTCGQMYPKHSYGEEGWHCGYGPLVLKTLWDPGDNLLLGSRFLEWGTLLPFMSPPKLPSHWLPQRGGWGGGMLIKTSKWGEEEWIFFLVHGSRHSGTHLSTLLSDVKPMLQARTIAMGYSPKLRVILGMMGERASPGRQDTRAQIERYEDHFRNGIQMVDELRGTYRPLEPVRISFGLAIGVGGKIPQLWKLCPRPFDGGEIFKLHLRERRIVLPEYTRINKPRAPNSVANLLNPPTVDWNRID